MAEDKLMFPIGFDLDSATKEAEKDWTSKYAAQLEKALQKRSVNIKLSYDIKQLNNLEAVQKRLKDLKVAPITPETRGAISSLVSELKKLETILKRIQLLNTKASLVSARAATEEARTKDVLARTLAREEKLKRDILIWEQRVEQAKNRTALAEERYRRAVEGTARSYSSTEGYVSRLLKRTAVLFSISIIGRFASKIREITAEFELQRVSLGAIIQDTEKANVLFNQIKTFAVQSPFEIKDLVGYVKQLSAYRIETDKLFDTTKRLADVSAGLGVDMGRLILAYGQVKAASVLRGSEVRQFTEAGIPLIELLADKFTALRGEVVSTSEVFDLISQRAVSFQMVAEIFEDMTNAGGMFYNMQEKQAQTLAGQWSNLKDSLSIMYDEMGRTSEVRGAMDGIIKTVKSLAENWQTVYQVVEGATLSIAAMVIAQKNSAIATAALTKQEAYYTAVKSRQIKLSPRWIASIIGERNARILSISAAKAHTFAMTKQLTATNILTKAFWKLTAAMLANPFVLITGAVFALGYAIYRLATNTETAADRIKSLNNVVGSMQQHTNTVKPLIESYNELSNKLDRTAAEEKKLQKVTQELANRYPGAVKSVQEFGKEIEIVSDKLNELYEAETKARREVTEKELEKTEKRIKEEEERIQRLQDQLERGKQTVYTGGGFGGMQILEGELSDKAKKNIIEQINEIRTGSKDGSGSEGLIGLINSANEAKRALGLIPSEAAEKINQFGSWRKTLQDFSRVVKTTLGTEVTVKLFDENKIANFKSLDEALKEVAETYKNNIKLVEEYNRTLESTSINEAERADVKAAKERAKAYADMALAAIDYYNQRKLLEEGGGRGTDDRLARLKEEVSLLEKVYNKYKEYTGYISKANAQERINREFGKTLDIFKKYGIELPKTSKEYQAALKKLQDIMRTLPKSQKDVMELGFKIENVDWEDTKRNLESEIKRLAEEVSRTKTAKEFFDKMLNMTGDRELSANVTMSIYGGTGNDLKQKIIDQIRNAFQTTTGDELDLSLAINYNTLEVDYLKLQQIAEANKDILLSKSKETRDGIIKAGLETTAARIMQWEKDIQKEQSYAEKRIQIAQDTAEKIIDIERSNLPEKEKERLTKGYKQRETEQVGQLMWDAFKDTPLYVKMFDNLDTASSTMLNSMRDKLKELEAQWGKTLSPTELKELQSRMNEIEKQLAMKNPFKTLNNSIKEYIALRKQGTRKQAEEKYAADVEAQKEAWDKLNDATKRAEDAKISYERLKTDPNANKQELAGAEALVNLTKKQVDLAKQRVNETGKSAEESEKLVSRWKQLADMTHDASTAIGAYTEMIVKAGKGIIKMMEAFGSSEEDMQFMEDIVGGIGKIGQGAQDALSGILSGNPVAAISGIVSGLGNIVSGVTDIFYAGRIRKANKEIKRQQEILDALEHSYDRLQNAANKVFGSEFVENFRKQQNNLRAQIAATEKQLEAEKSKGKKKDNNKIKDYQEQIQSLKDQLEDLTGTLSQQMLGTDLAGAARSFAQSWLDAYKEFGDTRKAIEEEMQKMMENLIVESVLSAVMQKALQPVFDMIDEMGKGDFYNDSFWEKVVRTMNKATDDALTGANAITSQLEKAGVNIRDLGSDFTGISKDIATASEESILGLTSLINTSLFYVSNIDHNVAQIVSLLSGGGYESTSGEQLTDLITMQNQHLAHLPSIALYTSQTAERCERAAQACESMAENLNRVIKPNGVNGTHRIVTSIQS